MQYDDDAMNLFMDLNLHCPSQGISRETWEQRDTNRKGKKGGKER